MLSRIAEALFWIGRYVERADGTARIVDALRLQLLEDPSSDEAATAGLVLHGVMGLPAHGTPGWSTAVHQLVLDPDAPSSITGSLNAARDNARRARETLSSELWEVINTGYLRWNGFEKDPVGERHLSWVRERAALVAGIADSTMNHDDAWRFLVIGRLLERADMTARLVAAGGLPGGGPAWSAVLASCRAQQAFMRSNRGVVTDRRIAAFLTLDRLFPRSVLYSLVEAERQLAMMAPEFDRQGVRDEARRQLGAARAMLEFADTDEILRDLPARMTEVQKAVMAASGAIRSRYFHAGTTTAWTEELV